MQGDQKRKIHEGQNGDVCLWVFLGYQGLFLHSLCVLSIFFLFILNRSKRLTALH